MKRISAQEVRSIILLHLDARLRENGIDPSMAPDDLDLLTEGIIDSMGILEIITAVEEHFNIQLDFESLPPEQLTVLGPFSRFVESRFAPSNGPHS